MDVIVEFYCHIVKSVMRKFYDSLNEKDRRRYAAVEVAKLGHGGIEYIAQIPGCDPKTIGRGRDDLAQGEDPAGDRIRKKRGRKRLIGINPQVGRHFPDILREHTAGTTTSTGLGVTVDHRLLPIHRAHRAPPNSRTAKGIP